MLSKIKKKKLNHKPGDLILSYKMGEDKPVLGMITEAGMLSYVIEWYYPDGITRSVCGEGAMKLYRDCYNDYKAENM